MKQQQGAGGGADLQLQMRGKEEEEELVLATWDCGSPLYDSFELASLHHVLESHLMVLPFTEAAASRSRRLEQRGGSGRSAPPDAVSNRCAGAARRKRKKAGRRTGWRGSKAVAAIFRHSELQVHTVLFPGLYEFHSSCIPNVDTSSFIDKTKSSIEVDTVADSSDIRALLGTKSASAWTFDVDALLY
ncbi:hypothetical protein BS78_03G216400 [Paspalum vaginatum]|nr:hypothetical protein BS78_03G216400 [Paspalum vaginatum]